MITGISVYQDNKIGNSDLLPVHSPLVFLIDVSYSGAAPNDLYAILKDENDLELATFNCIPYRDVLATVRRFAFVANDLIRGYMDGFDDEVTTAFSIAYVNGITKIFKVEFKDPDEAVASQTIQFTAIHGANQFGENPNKDEIYNNEAKTYIGVTNKPVYIYFYNNDVNNVITLQQGGLQEVYALDYDDDFFTDYLGNRYTITVNQ